MPRLSANIIILPLILLSCANLFSQQREERITLDKVIDTLSLASSAAEIERLHFRNDLLQFENYRKGLLPAFSVHLSPVNFNRSLRLLQQPSDGSYTNIEDYANNSSAGVTIRQKIALTGGELNIGSSMNYLREFSRKRNSFSTNPFTIGYSQQIWGGGKLHRIEKKIEYARSRVAVKQYCSKISEIQRQSLTLFMEALLGKMECDRAFQTKTGNDTLLHIAKIKLENGSITEYDYNQIELQSLNAQYASEDAVRNYHESRQRLFTYLGIEGAAEIAIPDFSMPPAMDAGIVGSYVEKNNPFSQQQEIEKMEAEKRLFSARMGTLFNGSISLNYGINQYAATFAEAYRHGNTRQSVVIGIQIPVFQWGINKNRLQMAKNDCEASRLAIERRRREFENEVKEKVSRYNHSVKLWLTAAKAYKLSQEQYRMLIRKFSLGKISVYELTAAQNDRNSAMQRYYSAIRDTYSSYFFLRSMALYDFKRDVELEEVFIHD